MTTPYGPPPSPWAAGSPVQGPAETEPKAIVALVLAVLAWTPTVPFIGAIAALFVARSAERDIDRSGGAKSGRSLTKAARVLSWVHLVVVTLLFLGFLMFFALPFVLGL